MITKMITKMSNEELSERLEGTVNRLEKARFADGGLNHGLTFEDELAKGIRENYAKIKSIGPSSRVSFGIKAAADMTFSANFSDADNTVTDVKPGIVALPSRRVHIRQVLAKGSMGKSDFTYAREGEGEGSIAPVAEGALKPQFDIDFTEHTVSSEYIPGFLVITKKMLDDVDSMVSFLQNRLREKYLRAEDQQLLTGNGISPNLSGLITNATAATTAATNNYDQILDGLAQIEAADYNATAILINPATYYKIAQNKASTSGVYDKPGIVNFVNGQMYFNGVPVYRTTAIAAKNYLIGDFEMGAQLMIRSEPQVEFFEQDNTNVRYNKITVRVEGRVALPVYSPGAFITGTFASY